MVQLFVAISYSVYDRNYIIELNNENDCVIQYKVLNLSYSEVDL